MHEGSLVSVVIPAFNCRERIEGAIRSTLAQDLSPLEVIVVDDCSTDGTDCVSLANIDRRVRFIRLDQNRGGAIARNIGIDAASGEWTAFCDADDRWLPNKLSAQIAMLHRYPHQSAFACANVRFEGGRLNGRVCNARPPREHEDISQYFLIHGCTFQTSTIVLPTQLARLVRFNELLRRHQDWDFVFRLMRAGSRAIYSHEPLVLYWDGENADRISNQKSIEPTLSWLSSARGLINPEAAAALYFRVCFRGHFMRDPVGAIKSASQYIAHNPHSIAWLTRKLSKRTLQKIAKHTSKLKLGSSTHTG
jgi:glycosyltransferase involved in cell wall biosynthesis